MKSRQTVGNADLWKDGKQEERVKKKKKKLGHSNNCICC